MPKMGVDPESIKAAKPVPADWYDLKLVNLKAKVSKTGSGNINYNGILKVVNSKADYNDSVVYFKMNGGPFQGFSVVDFCHMFGLHIEADGTFPGGQAAWIFDPTDPENVSKAQYKGPLQGRTGNAQVGVTSYEGNESNSVIQIRCKIEKCAEKFPEIKHRLNLLGKDKAA